jgi:protein-tyrosine phosphatase
MTYEPHKVFPNIWIGSAPDSGDALQRFDVLVLCAEEYQPTMSKFAGLVCRLPLQDWEVPVEPSDVVPMIERVARRAYDGSLTLVTCMAGLNRSALITAGAILFIEHRLRPRHPDAWTADDVVARIRSRHDHRALNNRAFVSFLQRYKP